MNGESNLDSEEEFEVEVETIEMVKSRDDGCSLSMRIDYIGDFLYKAVCDKSCEDEKLHELFRSVYHEGVWHTTMCDGQELTHDSAFELITFIVDEVSAKFDEGLV